MKTGPLTPRTIVLDTPHYIARTLESADITPAWQDWLRDPTAASNLNAKPATATREQLRDYVQSFNRTTSHLLGIFEKETGRLIGIRAIYLNPEHNEFLVNVLVGETEARNKGARSETGDAMYRYFFEEMGLGSARCSVLSTNEPILKVMRSDGWLHEHTSHKPAANGQVLVELRHFRLTREVWRRKEAEKKAAIVAQGD